MNIRQKYELKMLSLDGNVNMQQIAELFSISLRTVRYDIQSLNDFLYQELGQECITVTNKTAQVDDKVRKKLAGLSGMSVKDFYVDRLNSEERMLMILFDLCWDSHYSTIQDIADKYFVSRGTVNADMVALKTYCRKHDIRLVSRRGKGVCVEADEMERRRHLSKVIRDFTALTSRHANCEVSVYSQWFEEEALDKIKSIVTEVENAFSTYLDDISYEALVIHIALSMERFRTDSGYGEMNGEPGAGSDSLQYRMARRIVEQVNDTFQIRLPEQETDYVAVHIGARSGEIAKREKYGDICLEYYCLRTIADVSRRIDYDFTGDSRLYDSLFQHISACVYRKKNGMLLENPLKEELISNYRQLYEAVQSALADGEASELVAPTDDEIAYILLHFAASMNRGGHQRRRRADVAVVCATGAGTAELVVTGLNQYFKFHIKGAVAAHQLEHFLKKEDVDLIITTVPIQTEKISVKVSPILKREDIVRISKVLLDMGFNPETVSPQESDMSATARKVQRLLELYPSEENEEALMRELGEIAQYKNSKKVEGKYMLSDLINEKTIRLNVPCSDWEEAVREAGRILIDSGKITEAYVSAVIDNVKEMGPYIVITKGVALPHATNKEGVNGTAMSFISLRDPVNFGSKANDPVKYVFMLAAADAESHLGALQDLAEFLGRKDFKETLGNAGEPEDVLAYIKKNETTVERRV